MPEFLWRSYQSILQARKSEGFKGGFTLFDGGRTYWTMTAWESEAAMKQYRSAGAHRAAMAKLPVWCDEACVTHYEDDRLPSWEQARQRMRDARYPSVENPSKAHLLKQIAIPRPLFQGKV